MKIKSLLCLLGIHEKIVVKSYYQIAPDKEGLVKTYEGWKCERCKKEKE